MFDLGGFTSLWRAAQGSGHWQGFPGSRTLAAVRAELCGRVFTV